MMAPSDRTVTFTVKAVMPRHAPSDTRKAGGQN
jgi:hypothetical protein